MENEDHPWREQNGKGSVCAYLDGMLRSEQKRTGLLRPHLVKINEDRYRRTDDFG